LTAWQVGIDIHAPKARKILEDVSIPIESAILQLVPEGGAQLRKKRFSGDYADLNVETDSTGFYRSFTTSSRAASEDVVEDVDSDGLATKPYLHQTNIERACTDHYLSIPAWKHTQNSMNANIRSKPATTPTPSSPDDPEDAFLAFQRSLRDKWTQ
jgi:hypothetical protein